MSETGAVTGPRSPFSSSLALSPLPRRASCTSEPLCRAQPMGEGVSTQGPMMMMKSTARQLSSCTAASQPASQPSPPRPDECRAAPLDAPHHSSQSSRTGAPRPQGGRHAEAVCPPGRGNRRATTTTRARTAAAERAVRTCVFAQDPRRSGDPPAQTRTQTRLLHLGR